MKVYALIEHEYLKEKLIAIFSNKHDAEIEKNNLEIKNEKDVERAEKCRNCPINSYNAWHEKNIEEEIKNAKENCEYNINEISNDKLDELIKTNSESLKNNAYITWNENIFVYTCTKAFFAYKVKYDIKEFEVL